MDIVWLEDVRGWAGALVGGKAASLALLAATLPVPPGFCVTAEAHRRLCTRSPQSDPVLTAQITAAYRRLGGGTVVVRSSATGEDGGASSFAGQFATTLDVQGEAAILEAVARCWASLESSGVAAYRQRLDTAADLAMGVIVQRQVPAVVSGVLFTRDPCKPVNEEMIVEAGPGAAGVVSGTSTPERFILNRDKGAVVGRPLPGSPNIAAETPCLDEPRLTELAALGRRVEERLGSPQDIEWAWDGRQFWVLQARPITGSNGERERVRREEIAALAAKARPGGTVWSRSNLAETLPEATPMTWSILQRLLCGRGGLGQMYRDLGFRTDPALDEEGSYDLVCGRPYCNLSREPGMYAQGLPLEHDFAALKASPAKALVPEARLNLKNAGPAFWVSLPLLIGRSLRVSLRLRRLNRAFAARLEKEILPAFQEELKQAAAIDLRVRTPQELHRLLELWIQRTLCDFAREGLKPTVLAAHALNAIERLLTRSLGQEQARACARALIVGVRPAPAADLAGALRALALGQCTRASFLEQFGHRGPHEMELAQPRWAEDPSSLEGVSVAAEGTPDGAVDAGTVREQAEARLGLAARAAFGRAVEQARTYLSLRETARHYSMAGYALIRRILVELDWRCRLGGGIFYLTPQELPSLIAGNDLSSVIAERRRRSSVGLTLELPSVIFSDDLEAIGRPGPQACADGVIHGVPLSAGVAEGTAVVLQRPEAGTLAPVNSILVCPSTDPAWTPWLVQARGLVAETGGVLSHGAIIARELGLPAVAGIPGIHRQLRNGQRLRIDGTAGTIEVLPQDAMAPPRHCDGVL